MYLSLNITPFKVITIYRDIGVASFKNGTASLSEDGFLIISVETKTYYFNLRFIKDFIVE